MSERGGVTDLEDDIAHLEDQVESYKKIMDQQSSKIEELTRMLDQERVYREERIARREHEIEDGVRDKYDKWEASLKQQEADLNRLRDSINDKRGSLERDNIMSRVTYEKELGGRYERMREELLKQVDDSNKAVAARSLELDEKHNKRMAELQLREAELRRKLSEEWDKNNAAEVARVDKQRQDLQVYEREMLAKFDRLMADHKASVEKENEIRERSTQATRAQAEAVLNERAVQLRDAAARLEEKEREFARYKTTMEEKSWQSEKDLREKYEKQLEEERTGSLRKKRELEAYNEETREKFQRMLADLRSQMDTETGNKALKVRDVVERQIEEEKQARVNATRQQQEYEAEVQARLKELRDALRVSEEASKAARTQQAAAEAALATAREETAKRVQESKAESSNELSTLRSRLTDEQTKLMAQVTELNSQLAARDREAAIMHQRLQVQIEADVRAKSEQSQREFEDRYTREQDTAFRKKEEALGVREKSLATREKDLAEMGRRMREEADLEASRKVQEAQNAQTEKLKKTEDEFYRRDQERDAAMVRFQEALEAEFAVKGEELKAKEQDLKIAFEHKREALRDERTKYEASLYAKLDERAAAVDTRAQALAEERESLDRDLRAKYERLRAEDEARLHTIRTEIEAQAKETATRADGRVAEMRARLDREVSTLSKREAELRTQNEELERTLADRSAELERQLRGKSDAMHRELADKRARVELDLNEREKQLEIRANELETTIRAKYEGLSKDAQAALRRVQDDAQARDKAREEEKSKLARDLQSAYEEQLNALLEREAKAAVAAKSRETAFTARLKTNQDELMAELTKHMQSRQDYESEAAGKFRDLVSEQMSRAAESEKARIEELRERERKLAEDRKNLNAEVKRKADLVEQELAARYAKLEQSLGEAADEREALLQSRAVEIEERYEAGLAALKEKRAAMEQERADFEAHVREAADRQRAEEERSLEARAHELAIREEEMTDRFNAQVKAFDERVQEERRKRQDKQREAMEQVTREELSRKREQAQAEAAAAAETDAVLKKLKDELEKSTAAHTLLTAEIQKLKGEMLQVKTDAARDESNSRIAAAESLSKMRRDLDLAAAEKDATIAELSQEVINMKREADAKLERARGDIEHDIRSRYDQERNQFESTFLATMENNRGKQNAAVAAREAALANREKEVTASLAKTRQDLELQMAEARAALEREFDEKATKAQAAQAERERALEKDKLAIKAEQTKRMEEARKMDQASLMEQREYLAEQERNLVAKYDRLTADMNARDASREADKLTFKAEADKRVDEARARDTVLLAEKQRALDEREAAMTARLARGTEELAERERALVKERAMHEEALSAKLEESRAKDLASMERARAALAADEKEMQDKFRHMETDLQERRQRMDEEKASYKRELALAHEESRAQDKAALAEAKNNLDEAEKRMQAKYVKLQDDFKTKMEIEERAKLEKEKERTDEIAAYERQLEHEKASFEQTLMNRTEELRKQLMENNRKKEAELATMRRELIDKSEAQQTVMQAREAELDKQRVLAEDAMRRDFEKRTAEAAGVLADRKREMEAAQRAASEKMAAQIKEIEKARDAAIAEAQAHEARAVEAMEAKERDLTAKREAFELAVTEKHKKLLAEMERREAEREDAKAAFKTALLAETDKALADLNVRALQMEKEKAHYDEELHQNFRKKMAELETKEKALQLEQTEYEKHVRAQFDAKFAEERRKMDADAELVAEKQQQAVVELEARERDLLRRLEDARKDMLTEQANKEKELKVKLTQKEEQLQAQFTAFAAKYEESRKREEAKLDAKRTEIQHMEGDMMNHVQAKLDELAAKRAQDVADRAAYSAAELEKRREFEQHAADEKEEYQRKLQEQVSQQIEDHAARHRKAEQALAKRAQENKDAHDERMRELEERKTAMHEEKARYERELRDKHATMLEHGEAELANKRRELEGYEKNLYDKFAKMVETHKLNAYNEARAYLEQTRKQMEEESAEELSRRDAFTQKQAEYEAQVARNINQLRKEIANGEERIKTHLGEIQALKSQNLQQAQEAAAARQELVTSDQKARLKLKEDYTKELIQRTGEIAKLSDALLTLERESKLLLEKTRGDVEAELTERFQKAQDEQERKLMSIVDEAHKKFTAAALAERAAWEAELHSHYAGVINESDRKWHLELEKMARVEGEKLRKQRQELQDMTERNIEKILADWHDSEAKGLEERLRFEQEVTAKYEKLMEDAKKKQEQLAEEKEAAELAKWVAIEEAFKKHEAYETQMREKMEKDMEAQRALFMESKHELEEHYRREMDSRDKYIADQAKNEQIARAQYEEQLRGKYLAMMEAQAEEQKAQQERLIRRDVEELERRAALERERATMREEIEKESELSAKTRYANLIAELEETWRNESAAREVKMEGRLTYHFEELLRAKAEQLDLALKINDEMDKNDRERWNVAIEELKRKHLNTMSSFEEKIRLKYEAMMAEYDKLYHKQIQEYEVQRLEDHSNVENDKRSLDSRMRKMKIAFAKWKYDYQFQVQVKYEGVITELQTRYLKEVEERSKDLASTREREIVGSILDKERSLSMRRYEDDSRAERDRANNKTALNDRLLTLKSSVHKMWDALEMEEGETNIFLKRVTEISHDMEAVVSLYEKEHARLSDRLPLMQSVARREFLKYRLECIHKFSHDPTSRMPSDSASRVSREAREYETLWSELRALNDRLLGELSAYERKHGEKFFYRGQDYVSVMRNDAGDIQKYARGPPQYMEPQSPVDVTPVRSSNSMLEHSRLLQMNTPAVNGQNFLGSPKYQSPYVRAAGFDM